VRLQYDTPVERPTASGGLQVIEVMYGKADFFEKPISAAMSASIVL